MLTKDSAAKAADELISQQSARKREAADARARVSFLYMSKGLRALRPADRVKTVRQAQRTVARRESVIAGSLLWVAIWWLVGYAVLWPFTTPGSALAFGGLCILLMWVVRTILVRREIRRLLAAPTSIL